MHAPGDGGVDPTATTDALVDAARAHGATVIHNSVVTSPALGHHPGAHHRTTHCRRTRDRQTSPRATTLSSAQPSLTELPHEPPSRQLEMPPSGPRQFHVPRRLRCM
ncbi:FAD-dependent oxidoreductase [Streptomyces yokosukanensis]|uniref:FAD-dependent oxidoreductase n=1 Tax=Streptomyces yokosukanensis TaxID=67386 RepID=UPI00344074D3